MKEIVRRIDQTASTLPLSCMMILHQTVFCSKSVSLMTAILALISLAAHSLKQVQYCPSAPKLAVLISSTLHAQTSIFVQEVYEVYDEQLCQYYCRENIECNFFSLVINVCDIYKRCDICSTGGLFPRIAKCDSNRKEQYTLLMSGTTATSCCSSSIEILTSSMSCTPLMAQIPVGRYGASAILLGSRIYYC